MRKERSRHVTWSPASRDDLRDIGDHAVQTYSLKQAEEFLTLIYTAGQELVELPLLWRVREDMGDIRLFPIAPYFICYRVQDEKIEIVRIVHQKRDIAALLSRPRI